MRPVPHLDEIPIPVFNILPELSDDESDFTHEANNSNRNSDSDFVETASTPQSFNQEELYDLIRDLGLSKDGSELLALRTKNKLKRENAFCRLNMAKINQEWRSILRQVKCDELRHEIEELDKGSREALERKGQTIQRLLHDLAVAEDMYATQQQAHLEIVNRLTLTHQNRLKFIAALYEHNKSNILHEYMEDFNNFKELRDKGRMELECVMYQLEVKGEREFKERQERHFKELEDIRSSMQLRLEQISNVGETKLEKLWQEYQDVLSGYVKRTETFYNEYMELKQSDEENAAIVRENNYEIQKATDQVAQLKLYAADLEEKNEVSIKYLENMRNELSAKYIQLKERVNKQTLEDQRKFKLMSVISYKTVKKIQNIVKKGETLLQLCVACSKLESEREHLLPLGLPPIRREAFQEKQATLFDLPRELSEKISALGNWLKMENFWKRGNNVTIEVTNLKNQKQFLELENEKLKNDLQDFMVELNLSNGSNLHVESYLKQRPQSMYLDRVKGIDLGASTNIKKSHSASAVGSNKKVQLPRPITSYVEANFTNVVRSRNLLPTRLRMTEKNGCSRHVVAKLN